MKRIGFFKQKSALESLHSSVVFSGTIRDDFREYTKGRKNTDHENVHNHRRERGYRLRNGRGDGEKELQGHLRRPGWEENGTRDDDEDDGGRQIVVVFKDRDRRDGFERPKIDRAVREEVHGLGRRVRRPDK